MSRIIKKIAVTGMHLFNLNLLYKTQPIRVDLSDLKSNSVDTQLCSLRIFYASIVYFNPLGRRSVILEITEHKKLNKT